MKKNQFKSAKKPEAPEETAGDTFHAVVRASLSAVPMVGGAAVELFTQLVTPPLERRRAEWMREIGEALQRLEQEKGVDVEALGKDEAFIDTIMQASQAAIRNSQIEKRAALRNAVINSALSLAPEIILREMFIGWIDELTVMHLRILKFFQSPNAWSKQHGCRYPDGISSSLEEVMLVAMPELNDQREVYDQVWRELNQRGLVNTSSLHGMMSPNGATADRAADLGNKFLSFIEEPEW